MDGPLTGGVYEIVVGAAFDPVWSQWFDGFAVESEGRTTRLRATVTDQAALHGVLARLRDLGLPILDMHRTGLGPGDDEWGRPGATDTSAVT